MKFKKNKRRQQPEQRSDQTAGREDLRISFTQKMPAASVENAETISRTHMSHLDPQLEIQIREIVPRMEGWCPVDKALDMALCAIEFRPRICVEIGVFGGRSLLPIALACESIQHGHVFGIDPWSTDDSLENMGNQENVDFWSQVDHEAIYRGCLQVILDEGLTPFCSLIRNGSQHCADLFEKIDFLHIDGNHDMATRDVRLFLPRVRDGGHIWFDDANWNSTQKAVELLREQCEIVNDYGPYIHLRKRTTSLVVSPAIVETDTSTPSQSLARRIVTLPDDDVLNDYRGGVYNPGAVEIDGQFLLLPRNEQFTEPERQHQKSRWWGTCRPLTITLDASGDVADVSPLAIPHELDRVRIEDYRLFRWNSGIYASFSHVQPSGCIDIRIARVDHEQHQLGDLIQPQIDMPIAQVEKNWCFFEHRDDLYLIYSFQPFRLLRLNNPNTFRFETIASAPVTMLGQPHALRFTQQISLSTSPVEFRGDLIFFIHSRDSEQNYHHYAVFLDSNTLRPKRMSRHPLFSGGDASGLRPNVLYLMSVVRSADDYWFFFGEGDSQTSFLTLSESRLGELLVDSIEIELNTSPRDSVIGQYTYEHRGLFQRTVFLRGDGSIENGRDHDSHWRVERLGEQDELWIFGSNELSCRMNPAGTSDWSGTWNHGSRPHATLTRLPADR